MGCCNSASGAESGEFLNTKLKDSVENGPLKKFTYYLALKSTELKGDLNIDLLTFKNSDGDIVNLLGLCFIFGRLDLVKYLKEIYSASFLSMETHFHKHGTSALHIICEHNYIEMMEYYVPIYLNLKPSLTTTPHRNLRETINLGEEPEEKISEISDLSDQPEEYITPIQSACIHGHISIIKFALNYTSSLSKVPSEINIHYIEKSTGYNCALYACKSANYSMIKFLHLICKADFKILNNNKENAIQVMAAEARHKNLVEFYQCLVYLVEKVQIDISYNYEETIVLLEYVKAVDYFISKLEALGIKGDKKKVEEEVLVKAPFKKEESKFDTDNQFVLSDIFNDLKNNDTSTIKGSEGNGSFSDDGTIIIKEINF